MIVPVTWSLNSELVRRVDAPQRSKNVGQVAANPAKFTKPDSLRCESPICSVDSVDQLRQDFWGGAVCKCDTHKALDFPTFWFGTRRSMVQIHSPRPLFSSRIIILILCGRFFSRPFTFL